MAVGKLKLFGGNANKELAMEIAKVLKVPLGKMEISKFSDGEIYVRILESVRGADVFIVQPTCSDVNEHLIELLIIVDAMKRSSPARINVVVPYYGYCRQERQALPREPITAKLVANLLTKAGIDRIICVDLHANQIQGYFDLPSENLYAMPLLAKHLKGKKIKDAVIVSPDMGGAKRARYLAKKLGVPIAVIDKRRPKHNEAEVMHIIGDVKEKNCIIIDDIVDTAGTITTAAKALKKAKCKDVYVCATHPLMSGAATDRLEKAPIKEVIVTNTVPLSRQKRMKKLKIISIAPLLAESIKRINENKALSDMFD